MAITPVPNSVLDLTGLNTIKRDTFSIKGQDIYYGATRIQLNGTNLTDEACFPKDPVATAKMLSALGKNWVRLHHIDYILIANPSRVKEIVAFMDACYNMGILVSIDGQSKQGESTVGVDAYRLAIYKDPVKNLFPYLQTIQPILQHKALFLFCLVNEGAHVLVNSMSGADATKLADTFYTTASAQVRALGFNGFITDLSDGWNWADVFLPVLKKMDICTIHYYNAPLDTGNRKFMEDSWPYDGWNWGNVINVGKASGKPVLIQEWRSIPHNPKRGANAVFFLSEINRNGFAGHASFCLASNADFLAGNFTSIDQYASVTDLPGLLSEFLGSIIMAYDTKAGTTYSWGQSPGWSQVYSYSTSSIKANVNGEQATITIKQNDTIYWVFSFDRVETRGLEVNKIDQNWRQITNAGTKDQISYIPPTIDLGLPIANAMDIDPKTGNVAATVSINGTTFQPVRSCSVTRVSIAAKTTA